ncbi:MAG: hypothetical protein L6246_03330 [Thermodesulfovibrionales bacterium]|nr:hypothetical protein [Nitrospinota bacterium]MCG2709340.1 hypothetical protein [Thermodesulfovibrionales bacterium]
MFDFIFRNKNIFFYFVNICNEKYRSGHELSKYKEIIKKHTEHSNLEFLLNDPEMYPLIIETLKAFNMDQKGAKLTTAEKFKESLFLNHVKEDLIKLSNYKLFLIDRRQIEHEITGLLENVFCNLKVMETKRRIVGVSKALHFLLPDLVMLMDSKYTMTFFFGYNKYSKDVKDEFNVFKDIFIKTYDITRGLCLTQKDVDGKSWNTSVPKLIDNAIIGFNRYFDDCVMRFSDDSVEKVILLVEQFTKLEPTEKKRYEKSLEKQKDKILKSVREKIREKLLIRKAIEAGINVSEEEIEAYLLKKTGGDI